MVYAFKCKVRVSWNETLLMVHHLLHSSLKSLTLLLLLFVLPHLPSKTRILTQCFSLLSPLLFEIASALFINDFIQWVGSVAMAYPATGFQSSGLIWILGFKSPSSA